MIGLIRYIYYFRSHKYAKIRLVPEYHNSLCKLYQLFQSMRRSFMFKRNLLSMHMRVIEQDEAWIHYEEDEKNLLSCNRYSFD